MGWSRRLALTARDEGVRQTLLKAAAAYLQGDEAALDPAFMGAALDVYVAEGDLARVQDLAGRALASQDPQFRPAAIRALTQSDDMETATWLLDGMGLNDNRLRSTELLGLVVGVAVQDKTRTYGIDWFDAHYEALAGDIGAYNVSLRISARAAGVLLGRRCGTAGSAILGPRCRDACRIAVCPGAGGNARLRRTDCGPRCGNARSGAGRPIGP